jgi:hypothetical protein
MNHAILMGSDNIPSFLRIGLDIQTVLEGTFIQAHRYLGAFLGYLILA